jgi:hypothetical protein
MRLACRAPPSRTAPPRRAPPPPRAAGGGADKSTGPAPPRQPWDARRFLQTLFFFNPPPSPAQVVTAVLEQPVRVMEALTGRGGAAGGAGADELLPLVGDMGGASASGEGVVLVAGATGGVGRAVVAELLRRGTRVRSLAPSAAAARAALAGLPAGPGGALDAAPADLAAGFAPTPVQLAGVRRLVFASTEPAERAALGALLAAAARPLGSSAAAAAAWAPGAGVAWGALDDVVMGGASSSSFSELPAGGEAGAPCGIFAGRVTSANSGGFASARTRNFAPPLALGAYSGLQIRLRGDGNRYKLVLRCAPAWDGVGYTASFDADPAGEWVDVRLPWGAFVPVFRAKTAADAPPFDPESVHSLQLMLSKFDRDGALNPRFKEGPFELRVVRVGGYVDDGAAGAAPRVALLGAGDAAEAAAGAALRAGGVPCAAVAPAPGAADAAVAARLVAALLP